MKQPTVPRIEEEIVMLAIRRILVPIDFSECSSAALEYAIRLGQTFGASLEVLHVLDTPGYMWPGVGEAVIHLPDGRTTVSQFIKTRARTELESLIERFQPAPGVELHGRLEMGDPGELIVETAAEGHYDLVVMGTHGRRGLSHLFTGSVAERVVRRAPCPVLTIRTPEDAAEAPRVSHDGPRSPSAGQ